MLKPSCHLFRTDIAAKYGVPAAVVLEHIRFWTDKNKANGTHFYDGRYWTYNSIKAFAEMFPYLSEKQLRTTLNKLENEGVILKGNYNTSPYDRTAWYALSDLGEALFDVFHLGNVDLPKWANGNPEKGEPIPYKDTDNNITPVCISADLYRDKAYNTSQPTQHFLPTGSTADTHTSPERGASGGKGIPYQAIVDSYNECCPSLPRCKLLTDKRKKAIKSRFADGFTAESLTEVFRKAEASTFLKGGGAHGFVANFDFLIGEKAAKVLEGVYDDNTPGQLSEQPTEPKDMRGYLTDEEFDALFALKKERE